MIGIHISQQIESFVKNVMQPQNVSIGEGSCFTENCYCHILFYFILFFLKNKTGTKRIGPTNNNFRDIARERKLKLN